jgi:hypothetical protein
MRVNLPAIYSQRDPKWENQRLGTSNTTIGSYGCLVTCLAMISTYYGHEETPPTMNEKLIQHNGFANGNLYCWETLHQIYPDIEESKRNTNYLLNDSDIVQIKQNLNQGYPVIIRIDHNPDSPALDSHYVVFVDYDENDEDNFTIADPWTGNTRSLKDYLRAHKPTARDTIEQIATYHGSVPAIDYATEWIAQKWIFIDGNLHERFLIKSLGTKPLSDLKLTYKLAKENNPQNSNSSLLSPGEAQVYWNEDEDHYCSDLLIVIKPGIPKGKYGEHFGLRLGQEWKTGFGVWIEAEVD